MSDSASLVSLETASLYNDTALALSPDLSFCAACCLRSPFCLPKLVSKAKVPLLMPMYSPFDVLVTPIPVEGTAIVGVGVVAVPFEPVPRLIKKPNKR